MKPRISIIMGSDSDLPVMVEGSEVLDELGIAHEVRVLSAHRSPDETVEFARSAKRRGIRVIIAAAGKAAHLAGVVAAHTLLPVIGVPMKTSVSGGLDSLLSMVQMPRGVPVATVTIGGASNAALLAVEILALSDSTIASKLDAYRMKQTKLSLRKDKKLQQLGVQTYMKKKG